MKKVIGIFVVTLLFGTAIPVVYSADNNYTFTTSVYIGELTLGFDGSNKYVKYYND